jgi:alkylation response protein AidB-like acyl-CoA dehydrogenase
MSNYFLNNQDLLFHFNRLNLRDVVQILEHDYTEAVHYDGAPRSYEEALDMYRGSLELVGDLAGTFIAPRAQGVDEEGTHLENGTVTYARGTREALARLAEAGLTGVILPRRYGGVNFPATIYMMMIEMVSQADASLMTLFGYQDVGETIARLGTEEQGREFLLKYTAGEWTGATCLTEPGAGSDLQSVKLEAYQDSEGQWRLRGLKHFISNGGGEVLVVLARTEPGTRNMFGLSLFVCHGANERIRVNRIEDKMGLNGSPTCELIFDDAPAQLLGKRRFGLINVLHILNHARFSVAAQAIGIAEAAYQETLKWARERVQFGKTLYQMPPIANTLIEMRVAIEASRSLLYFSAQLLDRRNKVEERITSLKEAGKPHEREQEVFETAAKYVDLLSPLVKYTVTEAANRVVYDAVQLHGGMGYMKEMPVERLARDVRITSIYEGATSVQVVGAYKHVLADVLGPWFDRKEAQEYEEDLSEQVKQLRELRRLFRSSLELVENHDDTAFREAAGRDLTDMYGALLTGYLLLDETRENARKKLIARRYIAGALARANAGAAAIGNGQFTDLGSTDEICGVSV